MIVVEFEIFEILSMTERIGLEMMISIENIIDKRMKPVEYETRQYRFSDVLGELPPSVKINLGDTWVFIPFLDEEKIDLLVSIDHDSV